MNMRVSSILVALVVAGFAAGCSEAPTAKYEAGQTALDQARTAEAEQYAPGLYKEATDSLGAALVEIQKQDGRFAAFRGYGKAEEIIAAAQQLAEKAAVEAAAEKERVRLADSTLIARIDSLIVDANSVIASAPRGKGSRVDLKVLQTDIDAASAALVTATDEYRAGSYLSAGEKLRAVEQQVVKVKTDVEAAIARLTTK